MGLNRACQGQDLWERFIRSGDAVESVAVFFFDQAVLGQIRR